MYMICKHIFGNILKRVWTLSCSQLYVLYTHLHVHAGYNTDTMNNRRNKTSLTYLPLTLLQGFEKGYSRHVRGSWRPNITEIFWPQSYGRQRCVFLVLQGCSTGRPGPTLLGDGFLYCILIASSLDPNSSGLKWPLRPDVAFLKTSRL